MLSSYPFTRNTVLAGLEPDDLRILSKDFYQTRFEARSVLQRQKTRLESVGFVESGLVSLRRTSSVDVAELALVGVSTLR